MNAQWTIADSESYLEMLRNGWRDTGFHRKWCGGTLVCAMMVIDEGEKDCCEKESAEESHRC